MPGVRALSVKLQGPARTPEEFLVPASYAQAGYHAEHAGASAARASCASDPTLLARSAAYGISDERRSRGE